MKNNKRSILILLIIFVVFNVIAFVIPSDFTIPFWSSYVFTVISFFICFVIWGVYFENSIALKSRFLNFSILYISVVYFIIQFIIFLVFKFGAHLPGWISILCNVLVLAISLILLISIDTSINYINSVENKVHKKVSFIKSLQVDIELLSDEISDADTKNKIKELSEMIRYSDPISDDSLSDIENQIRNKMDMLKQSTDTSIIEDLKRLIKERNKKCKILK